MDYDPGKADLDDIYAILERIAIAMESLLTLAKGEAGAEVFTAANDGEGE